MDLGQYSFWIIYKPVHHKAPLFSWRRNLLFQINNFLLLRILYPAFPRMRATSYLQLPRQRCQALEYQLLPFFHLRKRFLPVQSAPTLCSGGSFPSCNALNFFFSYSKYFHASTFKAFIHLSLIVALCSVHLTYTLLFSSSMYLTSIFNGIFRLYPLLAPRFLYCLRSLNSSLSRITVTSFSLSI